MEPMSFYHAVHDLQFSLEEKINRVSVSSFYLGMHLAIFFSGPAEASLSSAVLIREKVTLYR